MHRQHRWMRLGAAARRQNILRIEPIKSEIRVTRMAPIADGAVDGKGIISALQVSDERIALSCEPRSLLEGCVAGKELGGGTHANAEWHRHSAGTALSR